MIKPTAHPIVNRPQFGLAALMGAVITCALILGFIANMETHYRVVIRCKTTPADDQGLTKWFQDQEGVQNVTVTRTPNEIVCEFSKRQGSFELFTPPLADLGYTEMEGMNSNITKSSLIGGAFLAISRVPVFIWFAVAAAIAILLARKLVRDRRSFRSESESSDFG